MTKRKHIIPYKKKFNTKKANLVKGRAKSLAFFKGKKEILCWHICTIYRITFTKKFVQGNQGSLPLCGGVFALLFFNGIRVRFKMNCKSNWINWGTVHKNHFKSVPVTELLRILLLGNIKLWIRYKRNCHQRPFLRQSFVIFSPFSRYDSSIDRWNITEYDGDEAYYRHYEYCEVVGFAVLLRTSTSRTCSLE